MEVSTCKCLISVFFAMIVCQAGLAVAVEQFEILPCTEGDSGGILYCIEYDSVGDVSYLHDNITRRITIKLPILLLTQLWLKQGKIVIVTLSGEVINNGQELIRSQDRERWTITFNFEQVNSDDGKLHLVLHIKDVKYIDEQYLQVEIRKEDNVFATRNIIWFPVQVKPNNGDNDHEGEAISPQNPAYEDPSAILQARIEALQDEKEVLQEEKMTAQNTSIHYQNKYYHCLEEKDDLEGSIKPKIHGKGQHKLDQATLGILFLVCITVMAYMTFMFKHSRLVHKTTVLDETKPDQVIQPDSELTLTEAQLKDPLLIKIDIPEEV